MFLGRGGGAGGKTARPLPRSARPLLPPAPAGAFQRLVQAQSEVGGVSGSGEGPHKSAFNTRWVSVGSASQSVSDSQGLCIRADKERRFNDTTLHYCPYNLVSQLPHTAKLLQLPDHELAG